MPDYLTEEQLEILERVRLDDKFATEPTPLLAWPMVKTLIAEIREQRQLLADIRAAVTGVRTYAVQHDLLIGECVAWKDLKLLTGIYFDPISNERYASPPSLAERKRQLKQSTPEGANQ